MQQYTFSRNILYSTWTMDKQEEYIQRYTKVRREEFHPTWTFYSSLSTDKHPCYTQVASVSTLCRVR